jgi:hypothetical protein
MNYESKNSIRNNEIRALFLIEKNNILKAEKLLLKNLKSGSANTMTFDLLIRIYHEKDDYSSLIKTLDNAIEKTTQSLFYRTIKKQAILARLFTDLELTEPVICFDA